MSGAPARRRLPRAGAVLCALVAVLALAPPARATTCGRPDLLDAVPPDGTTGVPPNASLSAHYDASAEYANEDVVLTLDGGVDEVVKVSWDATQGLLTYAPDAPLPPGKYTLVWPTLRGLNTAAPGLGATVHFTVGTVDDVAPPEFDGLAGVTWILIGLAGSHWVTGLPPVPLVPAVPVDPALPLEPALPARPAPPLEPALPGEPAVPVPAPLPPAPAEFTIDP